jgi:hypothetical protein
MIVRESIEFKRGLSDNEIKDVLVGWRQGQFLINPYTNIVYVFIKEWPGENNMEIFSVGHLRTVKSPKNPLGKQFFHIYRKDKLDFDKTNFKPRRNLRSLTNEEWKIIKPSLSPEYINKLDSELKKFKVKVLVS